ncbi:MAG: phospholipid-binding protein MlaC [Polyangiaceae bacterium]
MSRIFAAACLVCVAALWALPARATDDPAAIISSTVNQVLDVLRDVELRKPERRSERIARLRAIADRVFDWEAMAQSSLGAPYRTLTDDQRRDFVRLFKDIIADDYMDDLDRFMGDEVVTVEGVLARGDVRVVQTLLVTHSRERVPIQYFMSEQRGRWVVQDFEVEGVSLVNHYRTSFANYLVNHTFQNLLERLRARHPG